MYIILHMKIDQIIIILSIMPTYSVPWYLFELFLP